MLTAKEIPYTTIPRGVAMFEKISTHSRARQIMLRNVRKFRKFIPQQITAEFERQRTINSGLWVERSDLTRLSGTQFVKPSLHFNTSFLMKANKVNRDDRVHRTIPLIPTVPPEILHEYKNKVQGKEGNFQGRNPDTKYKVIKLNRPLGPGEQESMQHGNGPKIDIRPYQFHIPDMNMDVEPLAVKMRRFLEENLLLEEGASDETMFRLYERAGPVLWQQNMNRKLDRGNCTRNALPGQESLQAPGFSDGEESEEATLSFSTSYSSVDRLPDDTSEDTDLTLPSTDEE
jgi:hypothetical protein